MKRVFITMTALLLFGGSLGCSGPLTTREKGAVIGTATGAGLGAIIGSATGHAGPGAGIGSLIGLGAGALIGDRIQGQQQAHAIPQEQFDEMQAEIDRQRREIEQLRQEKGY